MQSFLDKVSRPKRMTVNLSPDEERTLHQIIHARKQMGLTTDTAHFIRQCFHFIINREYFDGYEFYIPDKPESKAPEAPALPDQEAEETP